MTRPFLPVVLQILLVTGLITLNETGCARPIIRETVTLRVAITSSTTPLMDDLMRAYERAAPNVAFAITRGNAETVTASIRDGTADWGLVSYLPVETELWSAPLGTDTLVIVVNPQNTVSGLTRAQLRDIYQGRTLTWDAGASGSSGTPILVVAREQGSAARGAFDELVMSDLPTTPAARLAMNAESVLAYVEQEPGAIGYLSLALLDQRGRPVPIDGVQPSQETARSGAYRLATTIRFVALREPDGPSAALLKWLLAEEGQAVVAQHYAPLAH